MQHWDQWLRLRSTRQSMFALPRTITIAMYSMKIYFPRPRVEERSASIALVLNPVPNLLRELDQRLGALIGQGLDKRFLHLTYCRKIFISFDFFQGSIMVSIIAKVSWRSRCVMCWLGNSLCGALLWGRSMSWLLQRVPQTTKYEISKNDCKILGQSQKDLRNQSIHETAAMAPVCVHD